MQVIIPVAAIEFHEGSNTMWVHSPAGATVLRIKCKGRINTDRCITNPVSHADMIVEGDINICLADDAKKY